MKVQVMVSSRASQTGHRGPVLHGSTLDFAGASGFLSLSGSPAPRGSCTDPSSTVGWGLSGYLGQGQKDPGTQRPGLAVSARSRGRWDGEELTVPGALGLGRTKMGWGAVWSRNTE